MESPLHRQRREYGNGQVVVQVEGLVELRERRRERAKEDGIFSQPDGAERGEAHGTAHAEHGERSFEALLAGTPKLQSTKGVATKAYPHDGGRHVPEDEEEDAGHGYGWRRERCETKRSTHTCHRDKKSVDDRG